MIKLLADAITILVVAVILTVIGLKLNNGRKGPNILGIAGVSYIAFILLTITMVL